MYKPDTQETLALLDFAEAHGRKWKAELQKHWYNARLWTGKDGNDRLVGSILHGLRNHSGFGPEGLNDYKLREGTIDAIKAMGLGCTFIGETGEYRVTPNLGPAPCGNGFRKAYFAKLEAGAYYTDYPQDAIGTAKHMKDHASV